MPSRPIFTTSQFWAMSIALGLSVSLGGLSLLLAAYTVFKL